MLNIGPQELILILIVALVVVGPQRLPELGRTIGRALREFRKIQDDVKGMVNLDEVKNMVNFDVDAATESSRPAAPTPTTPGVHRAARPAPTEPTTPPATDVAGPESSTDASAAG